MDSRGSVLSTLHEEMWKLVKHYYKQWVIKRKACWISPHPSVAQPPDMHCKNENQLHHFALQHEKIVELLSLWKSKLEINQIWHSYLSSKVNWCITECEQSKQNGLHLHCAPQCTCMLHLDTSLKITMVTRLVCTKIPTLLQLLPRQV